MLTPSSKYQSTVVVTGVPTKSYRLPSEWIQPNTTVVNVASFKNVNADEILQIEGVQYIPMVGKVTGEYALCTFSRIGTLFESSFFNYHIRSCHAGAKLDAVVLQLPSS